MTSMSRHLLFILLMATSGASVAEQSFMISPSFGMASVDDYDDTTHIRIDGSYFIMPEFGINAFVTNYSDFETSGDYGDAAIELDGYGIGLIGRWQAHPRFHPYLRVDYFYWDAELTALGRNIGSESDFSTGIALGAQLPIKGFFGLKLEAQRYYDVSGADIDQLNFGATFEF
ncbi:MAG: outer membrane beta-barrel protein [Pseudomonadota bacterium]